MTFETPQTSRLAEPFVPMINVVFLLLIFFLMTAQIAPPEPFEVAPPVAADGQAPAADTVLYLSEGGELGFAELRGAEATRAAMEAAGAAGQSSLRLRVDGGAEAGMLAKAALAIAEAGASRLEIVTARP